MLPGEDQDADDVAQRANHTQGDQEDVLWEERRGGLFLR